MTDARLAEVEERKPAGRGQDKSDGYVLGVPAWARLRGLDWIGAAVAVERVIYV